MEEDVILREDKYALAAHFDWPEERSDAFRALSIYLILALRGLGWASDLLSCAWGERGMIGCGRDARLALFRNFI